jgi:RNA polymerase sigma-70 factor (ECF subfamily)
MRGDRDAELRRVYREHVAAVFAFFAYSVSRAHAEDLTSATFERVIRSWRRYDAAKASERTWILAIARNQLTDHYRRQRHRDAVSLDEHPMLADTLAGADEAQRRLDRDEVRSWLADLGERERLVLALRYGADLTARDIASLTDLSEANVHQILSRTLRKLRDRAERTLT